MGEAHYWLGEYPAARDALERAVDLGADLDDAFTLALALRFLGDIAINVEADLDKAEDLLDRPLAAAEELGDPWRSCGRSCSPGWVPWTAATDDEAETIWRGPSTAATRRTGGPACAPSTRCRSTARRPRDRPPAREDVEAALRLSEEASALAEATGDRFSIAVVDRATGAGARRPGRREERWRASTAAWRPSRSWARGGSGRTRSRSGASPARARTARRRREGTHGSTDSLEELGELQLASWTWRALAACRSCRGDDAEAERQARRSRDAEEQFGARGRSGPAQAEDSTTFFSSAIRAQTAACRPAGR